MNYQRAEKLYLSITDVKDELLDGLDEATAPRPARRRLRLGLALLAAALVLAIMGCGIAAAFYGEGIGEVFADIWSKITGSDMADGQRALVDSLSQELGQSETVDGVTVTVDSGAVGEDRLCLLLKVHGARFSRRRQYDFKSFAWDIGGFEAPMNAGGFTWQGIDGEGDLLMLLAISSNMSMCQDGRLELDLTLDTLLRDDHKDISYNKKLVAEGEWSFHVVLDAAEAFETLEIGDCTARFYEFVNGGTDYFDIAIRDIRVGVMGMRFTWAYGQHSPEPGQLTAVLRDGTEISCTESIGTPLDDETVLSSAHWDVPVKLEDIIAVKIGDKTIYVN